jgi:hypothetical protein
MELVDCLVVFSQLSLMCKEMEALAITVRDVWAPKYGSRLQDAGLWGARLTIHHPQIIFYNVYGKIINLQVRIKYTASF